MPAILYSSAMTDDLLSLSLYVSEETEPGIFKHVFSGQNVSLFTIDVLCCVEICYSIILWPSLPATLPTFMPLWPLPCAMPFAPCACLALLFGSNSD